MNDEPEQLRKFLSERDIRPRGLALGITPSAQTAWRYVARRSVDVTKRVPGEDILQLDAAFQSISAQLSLFQRMPVLLSISGFGCPWVRVEIPQRASLVQRLSVVPNEPSFILAPESGKIILGVDTEEWEYYLIAARWSNGTAFVPWSAT